MGKEARYRVKCFLPATSIPSKSLLQIIASEAYFLWNNGSPIQSKGEAKKNGIVYINLKEGTKEKHLSLRGFATNNNKVEELFRVLLTKRLIFPETRLISFKQYQSNTWREVEPTNSLFSNGDAFIIAIKPPSKQDSSSFKHKTISK